MFGPGARRRVACSRSNGVVMGCGGVARPASASARRAVRVASCVIPNGGRLMVARTQGAVSGLFVLPTLAKFSPGAETGMQTFRMDAADVGTRARRLPTHPDFRSGLGGLTRTGSWLETAGRSADRMKNQADPHGIGVDSYFTTKLPCAATP